MAHIILGHINNVTGLSKAEEDAADEWAGNFLISSEEYNSFKKRARFYESEIIKFANEQEIAPGIVVGRLQREGLIGHNMLNHLKEQYVISAQE